VVVHLRWYRVPDDTPWLPVGYLWSGRPWHYDQTPPSVGPGELRGRYYEWANGIPPPWYLDWLGSDDWWASGIPSSDPNLTPQVRPGVCQVRKTDACYTACDQCKTMSEVWWMDYMPPIRGLSQKVLYARDKCRFTSACADNVVGCKKGTAACWLVQPMQKIKGLSMQVMVARGRNRFSSCCDPKKGVIGV
jgi:hypothetical protein